MAFTYDETNLNTSTAIGRLNAVRLLVGDTDTSDQQVQNEEIYFALAQSGDNVYSAASWICSTIAAKYSRLVDTDLDGQLAEKYSQLQTHYKGLASDLEFKSTKVGASLGFVAGGLSKSTMKAVESNTDRTGSRIRRDQFRYQEIYSSDYLDND
jgi:hypothetical protein